MADAFESHSGEAATGDVSDPRGEGPIPNSRCVLWLHPQESVPKPLLRSLSRRIERTIFATDSYQAFAEVCSAESESKRDGGPSRVVLLMIKPARLAEAGDVLHHLDMYAPRTRRWRFDPSANPIFAPMSEQDIARIMRESGSTVSGSRGDAGDSVAGEVVVRPSSSQKAVSAGGGVAGPGTPIFPVLSSTPRPRPKPRLRLVETDPSAETIMGGPGATNFSQLTPEELQMLLNDPPGEGTVSPPPKPSGSSAGRPRRV